MIFNIGDIAINFTTVLASRALCLMIHDTAMLPPHGTASSG